MSEITGVRLLLAVANLKRPTDHYTSVLGFGVDFGAPGWSFLSRGSFQIMLGECTDAVPPGEPGDHPHYGCITVADVDALDAEYQIWGGVYAVPGMQDLRQARVRHPYAGLPQAHVPFRSHEHWYGKRGGVSSRPRSSNPACGGSSPQPAPDSLRCRTDLWQCSSCRFYLCPLGRPWCWPSAGMSGDSWD